MQGMHQNGANACDRGCLHSPQNGIAQQGVPYAPALKVNTHRESRQQHDRNRIGHVAAHAARSKGMADAAHRQRVITHHVIALSNDIGTAGSIRFILAGAGLQPFVQHGFPALERRKIVVLPQRARRGEWHAYLSQGAGVASSLRRAGEDCTGASSAA